eukprot:CAMPEP_0117538386 /NCGR_PEP_ID=MMETSP0784-20121206/42453_1 /TAXON_ID=39447 /ORGANISM="" /LENGTH=184 /DNA_ID=CAMNT_0005335001 /DNA_START=30 /DNA_END=584 /DNA_ORIENTATION=-
MGQASVCTCNESKISPGQADDEIGSTRQVFDAPVAAGPERVTVTYFEEFEPALEPPVVRELSTTPAKERVDAIMVAKDVMEPATKDGLEPVAEHTSEPQLELTFVREGKDPKVVRFEKLPIGLDFLKRMPLAVRTVKPGSFAAACGVESGWVLAAINGQDIRTMAVVEAMQLIKASGQALAPAM